MMTDKDQSELYEAARKIASLISQYGATSLDIQFIEGELQFTLKGSLGHSYVVPNCMKLYERGTWRTYLLPPHIPAGPFLPDSTSIG